MTKNSRLKTKLEELTDALISFENDEPDQPAQRASTTDPLRELKSPIGLGGLHLSKTRIQREIIRLQKIPTDALSEIEAKRLAEYHAVLEKLIIICTLVQI